MIVWFGVLLIALALAAALACLWVFIRGRAPNDLALGASALVGLGLVVQIVIAALAPALGNPPQGDPLEFWMYLIVAAVLPFAAGFWALIDRRRSGNLVLIVVHVSVAVMLGRMLVLWG